MADEKAEEKADPTIARLIDEADAIQEEYADLMDRKDNVRTALRALQGSANEEQKGRIVELFPPRTRKDKSDDETPAQAKAA